MGIFLRQSHNVKPVRWGSPAEVQFSIWDNLEDIYGYDYKSEVLIMPGFWGFPLLDYSKYGNKPVNHGSTFKDRSPSFDGDDYVEVGDVINNWTSGTISARASTYNSTQPLAIIYSGGGGTINRAYIAQHGTKWATRFGTSFYLDSTAANIKTNQFYDITTIWDANSYKIFEDGIETGSVESAPVGQVGDSNADRIGHLSTSNQYNFNGSIPEVRISKAARTADQIALFHENPYGLYRRVAKPIWSIPAAPSIYIPQIIMF